MEETSREEFNRLYSEISEIGSGGGGVIFKAYHQRLQKYVVLKKMHSQVSGIVDERIETDILKNLHHEYLPQVFDFIKMEGSVFTVMDFVEGKSFEQLIVEKTSFSKEKVLKYTRQLCEVMAYLHKQKPPILHGDIKPANLMLRPDDNICLIDFNIAGFLSEGYMITIGYSAGYAPPEQRLAVQSLLKSSDSYAGQPADRGEDTTVLLKVSNTSDRRKPLFLKTSEKPGRRKTLLLKPLEKLGEEIAVSPPRERESITVDNSFMRIDLRADVYSIGATMYHLATGRCPSEQLEKNPFVEDVAKGYSNGFSVIIDKAMEPEPARRFANAEELLRAVQKIHRYDRTYKTLMIRQELAYLVMVLFIGASVLAFFFGQQRMQQERSDEYESMLSELIMARESDSTEFDKIYEEVCSYMPERLDAAYQRAVYLEGQGRYEEDIAFIQEHLLDKPEFQGQTFESDTYYLLANCFFQLEQYKDAAEYYQAAVKCNGQVSHYYGDYAISLVYCGRTGDAEEVLRQGRERGLDSDYVLFVSAEIESAEENYDYAVTHFKECIDTTTNETMRSRAYVLCDQVLRKKGDTEEVLLESVELLQRARINVELSDKLLILERLAQDYMDLSAITGDKTYDEDALAVLDEIVRYGWGNDTTQVNRALQLEKLGRLDEARKVLQELIDEEPENYVYYKRFAVLEVDIQKTKPNKERNYEAFLEYYNRALDLYEESKPGTNDVEMQWLEQMLNQLIMGGWLEE